MLLVILLVAGFAVCAWWHIVENRQIAKDYKGKIDWQMERWLVRFAWSRTIQMLFVLGCAIAIATGDLPQAGSSLFNFSALQSPAAPATPTPAPTMVTAPLPIPATTPIAAPQPVVTPAPAPVQTSIITPPPQPATPPVPTTAPQKALDTMLGAAPPEQHPVTAPVVAAPAPKPVTPPPAAQPAKQVANATAAQTVDDVYNPEKKASDAQSSMDDIKKRYEDILVIYMFLKKCNKAKDGDYNIILSSLGQEMASVNAPGRLQYDILTSAQGSYKELYSKSACNGSGITPLVGQYNEYIKVLSKNVAPR